MSGTVPAWRPFGPGMTDGPDVRQLETNLITLGRARRGDSWSRRLRTTALQQWPPSSAGRQPLARPRTDRSTSERSSFCLQPAASTRPRSRPARRRHRATCLTPSRPRPGRSPCPSRQATRRCRSASPVSIQLPSGSTTGGQVTAIGPPEPDSTGNSQSSAGGEDLVRFRVSHVSVLTVTPANPAATGGRGRTARPGRADRSKCAPRAGSSDRCPGGIGRRRLGLEVVLSHSGAHHLIGVRTGVFANGDVQVLRGGCEPGTRVVVAQSTRWNRGGREGTRGHAAGSGPPGRGYLRVGRASSWPSPVHPDQASRRCCRWRGGLERPTAGTVRPVAGIAMQDLSDAECRAHATGLGFVFQQFHLLPRPLRCSRTSLTACCYRGLPAADRLERAAEAVAAVGLSSLRARRPTELSGGECQRTAIARAIVGEPALLLADEPTGNLDSVTGNDIYALLGQLHERGTTILLVTHNDELARRTPRMVALHDGRIERDSRR